MARSLGAITVDLLLKIGGFTAGMDQAAKESKKATDRIQRNATSAASGIDKAFTNIRRQFTNLFAGYVSVNAIKGIIDVIDQYKLLENRLRLVTSSTAELRKVQAELLGVAQRTRSPYADVAELYTKLALTGKDLGVSQRDILKFTEGVGNALTISGTSAQTARGALTQLAQGLAAGTFRAEEFNAVLEGAPEIIRVVARNIERFHGSLGALRLAVQQSKLGSSEFFEAFLKGSDDLAVRVRSLPVTISQAFTRLQNTFKQSISTADISPLVDSINELAATISDPQFQRNFAEFVALIIKLSGAAAKGLGILGADVSALIDDAKRLAGALTPDEARQAEMNSLRKEIELRKDVVKWLVAKATIGADHRYEGIVFTTNKQLEDQLALLEKIDKSGFHRTGARPRDTAAGGLYEKTAALPVIDPNAGKKAAAELDNARDSILKLVASMQQQIAVTGDTEEATMRYRIAFGDLAETFKTAGPGFEKYKQILIDTAAALDQFKAGEKVKELNKSIDDQLVAIRANRIEQTEGAKAALEYRLQYDGLAQTFHLAGVSIDEYRQRQRELIAEQATDTIEAVITDLEKQIDAIKLLKVEQEQGAEAAIRYRIAHGDLAQAFKDSGQSIEEYVAEFVKLRTELDGYAQDQAELDASYNIIPDRTKAVKEYDDALKGLSRRLKEHQISLDEYNAGVKIAEKNLKEATRAIDDLSVFAEQAAKNLQDTLADFLADPFKDGLDGMLENFADTLRKMAAQIIAARLADQFHFEDWFKGGGVLGGKLKDILGIGGDSNPSGTTGPGGAINMLMPSGTAAGGTLDPGLGAAVPALVGAGTTVSTAITAAGTTTATALTTASTASTTALTTALTAATAALTEAGTAVAAAITAAGTEAASAIAAAASAGAGASALGGGALAGAGAFPGGFAGGGKVFGPGTGTSDSVPAWLSAGEVVVKAAAVQQPGIEAMLERLNKGEWHIPRFAQGGLVVPLAAPHFGDGGRVLPTSGTVADKKAPFVVQQSITVNSPDGKVSKQTEMQITAAAARGARVADRHNN